MENSQHAEGNVAELSLGFAETQNDSVDMKEESDEGLHEVPQPELEDSLGEDEQGDDGVQVKLPVPPPPFEPDGQDDSVMEPRLMLVRDVLSLDI